MEKTIKKVGGWVLFVVMLDLWILVMSMGQAAVQGRSGQWNGWWSWQANAVISLLK